MHRTDKPLSGVGQSGWSSHTTGPAGAAAEGPAPTEEARDTGAAPSLSLCHNVIGNDGTPRRRVRSKSYVAKAKDCLRNEVEEAVRVHGLEFVGVLTVTIPEFPSLRWSVKEEWDIFMEQWRSFATNVVTPAVKCWARVVEPQRNGNIHVHAVVVFHEDIRTGFDFEAVKAKDYRSATPFLRSWWKLMREKAPLYGFKRCETLPIKSPKGFGFYVGKYLGKASSDEAQGFRGRRVSYSKSWVRCTSMQRAWAVGEGWEFRDRCKRMARAYGEGFNEWIRQAGCRWAFKFMRQWEALVDDVVPMWAACEMVGAALGVRKVSPEVVRVVSTFNGHYSSGSVSRADSAAF